MSITILENVTSVLDDFYQPSRPSKQSIDAKVTAVLEPCVNGTTSGDGAFWKVGIILSAAYGSTYTARTASAAILSELGIAFTLPSDETI